MESEILALIYDYSVKGKLVDLKFIDKLIKIVVLRRDLNNYIRNVQFINELTKSPQEVTLGSYNPFTMTISIDYESIKIAMECERFYYSLFTTSEQVWFRNLFITKVILHELEHAFQNKQVANELDDSIETKLVRACSVLEWLKKRMKIVNLIDEDPLAEYDKLYNQYYHVNPSERLAEINSLKTIVNSLGQIKKRIPELYKAECVSLLNEMLREYLEDRNKCISCPTQVYLLGTKQDDIWYELDFYSEDYYQLLKNVSDQYSLDRRLSLGLPIDYDEHIKLLKRKKNLLTRF